MEWTFAFLCQVLCISSHLWHFSEKRDVPSLFWFLFLWDFFLYKNDFLKQESLCNKEGRNKDHRKKMTMRMNVKEDKEERDPLNGVLSWIHFTCTGWLCSSFQSSSNSLTKETGRDYREDWISKDLSCCFESSLWHSLFLFPHFLIPFLTPSMYLLLCCTLFSGLHSLSFHCLLLLCISSKKMVLLVTSLQLNVQENSKKAVLKMEENRSLSLPPFMERVSFKSSAWRSTIRRSSF